MTETQARADPEAVDAVTQVGPDLCLPGEGIRPAGVASEGVRVQVRRDVAGATGVAVVAPRPADIVGLLEDEEAAETGSLETDRATQAGEAGADDRHIGVRRLAHLRPLLPRRRILPAVTTVLSPRQIRKGAVPISPAQARLGSPETAGAPRGSVGPPRRARTSAPQRPSPDQRRDRATPAAHNTCPN